jgi:hypothetical protein
MNKCLVIQKQLSAYTIPLCDQTNYVSSFWLSFFFICRAEGYLKRDNAGIMYFAWLFGELITETMWKCEFIVKMRQIYAKGLWKLVEHYNND